MPKKLSEALTLAEMLARAAGMERDQAGHVTRVSRYPTTWETGDGRAVFIEDMEDGHLCNTIYYLRRKALSRLQQVERAWSPNSDELRRWFSDNDRHYRHLVAEAAFRGLYVNPHTHWSGRPNVPPPVPVPETPILDAIEAERRAWWRQAVEDLAPEIESYQLPEPEPFVHAHNPSKRKIKL